MSKGIIQLLPEVVANQIAAGEVIQRPASVVKELLENSIDAGADKIRLNIKDAGKTLIQIIDNGSGMNDSDAKACFLRHATSKITSADDLFSISTKGFRGEALASIASIAHVQLKTKMEENEMGTEVEMEGGKVIASQACQSSKGTQISVKNLFYNVPARRKFLKSDSIENRHILDEFIRVALIHPEISLVLTLNDKEEYHLTKGNFKQRIIALFGKNYNDKLVPVEETTDIVHIQGFILKPEYSKKTRGEQFFFANKRFIKHAYLHHAISDSFADLIPDNSFPSYFIEILVNPANIDVNIHPTKTEIKFLDEKSIYAILKATIKKSLNQYSVAPTLDFNRETSFDTPLKKGEPIKIPEIKINREYNPFSKPSVSGNDSSVWEKSSLSGYKKSENKGAQPWEKLYDSEVSKTSSDYTNSIFEKDAKQESVFSNEENNHTPSFFKQIKLQYILSENSKGLILIDQKRAHERVLFEHFLNELAKQDKKPQIQQLLFPETIELNSIENTLIEAMLPDLLNLGFDISLFGKNTYVINGIPSEFQQVNPKVILEELLEDYQFQKDKSKLNPHEILAKNLAKNMAIKYGQELQKEEMQTLYEQLFLCSAPLLSPSGYPTILQLSYSDLEKRFQ